MLPLLILCLFVATPSPHVAPGLYRAPHRAPDDLLESSLPDAHVRIWEGFRSVQGGTPGTDVPPASYPLSYIARRCGKSENALSKALIPLKEFGWVEEVGRDGKQLVYRCHVGVDYRRQGDGYVAHVLPDGKDDSACGEDSPTPPNKDSSYQNPVLNPETTTTSELVVEGDAVSDSEGVVVFDGKKGKALDPDAGARNRAYQALCQRGVPKPDATALAAEHWRRVPAALVAYDAGLADGSIGGVGWLISTVPKFVAPSPAKQAATHTGRTAEQDRGSKQAAEAAREIATGELPGTPGSALVREALEASARAAEESARRKVEEAERRREERRAQRRALQPKPE